MWHIFWGELFGTMVLALLGCGAVANVVLVKSKAHHSGWMVIVTGWFIGVVMGVFVAQSVGSMQADLNPAVSLAKYLLHMYGLWHLAVAVCAEMLGAFCGAVLVYLVFLPHWVVTTNAGDIRDVFCTTPAIRSLPANFICEVIASFLLIFGVCAIYGNATMGHPATGFGPYCVGLLVWGIGLSLGGPTGYAINPARDLAPRLAHCLLPIANKADSGWGYSWVPVAAPLCGAVLAALLWRLF